MINVAIIHSLSHQTGKKVVDSYGMLLEGVATDESVQTPDGQVHNVKTHTINGVVHIVDVSLMADQLNG